MAHKLTLKGRAGESEILIENGLFCRAADEILSVFSPSRIHIVTDSNVAPLYLQKLAASFSLPVSHTIIPAGEQHKRLSTIETLYHDLIANEITRSDLIIALGGGVIGDMAGFAAATFLRGVPICQIPTTLLAQVDSSVGGKTGVDLPEGKNLVGAFYQPRLVLIDPKLTDTLLPSVFTDGMAEVIKYGYIASEALLNTLETQDIQQNLEGIIYECVKIKRDVVAIDEQDNGLRMILNFGHTIGHAAEKAGHYTELTHGQAVAIGMVAALKLGKLRGQTDLTPRLVPLLEKVGLPTALPYSAEQIAGALLNDKKRRGGTINFILVSKVGQAEITPIETEALRSYLTQL